MADPFMEQVDRDIRAFAAFCMAILVPPILIGLGVLVVQVVRS